MRRAILKKLSPMVVILAAVLMVVAGTTSTFAQRPLNIGYFSGYDYGNTLTRPNTSVMIRGGLKAPALASKAGFEAFVLSKLGDGNINSGSLRVKQDKVGAAFIIQTMRGGTDYNIPNAAQIADWKARIDNNSVSFTQQVVSYTLDTGIAYRSAGGGRIQNDAAQYIIPTFTDTALVFGFSGGSYSIRIACANPVGDLGKGVPNTPIDYTLDPAIGTDRASAEAGTDVQVSPTVTNSGHAASGNSQWQLSQFVVAPGGSYPGANNSPSAPSVYYGNSLVRLDGGSGASFPVGGPTPIGASLQTIPDKPIGTKVCYALSVQARSDTDVKWAHSAPSCVVIAKKPKLQIQGGDLRVGVPFIGSSAPITGSNIQTSLTIKDGKAYGSWGEYGLIASGSIIKAASDAAYASGACATGCATTTFSFTNSSSTIGKYTTATNIPDVASTFAVSGSPPQFSSLADAVNNRVETSKSDIIINGGVIAKGHWLVINAPTKTVTIKGNITYDNGSLRSITDIPQLVIIADKINIEGNVSQVDAWLVASGTNGIVNTCSAWKGTAVGPTDKLTASICNTALTINGPVMARTLYLRRTAGADNAASVGNPAEVINLRPDAYLWAMAQVSKSARLETTYSSDLPPRF